MESQLPPPIPPAPVPPAAVTPKTPGLAIAALVLGIISVGGGSILLIPTILAIVFGHIAYSRIKKDPSLGGGGLAIAGFVLGYVSIFVGIITAGLLAAMAIPAFQKVRESSLQKAMVNDARQIAAAAQQVMLENGEQPVTFRIDPATGAVSGPISEYVKQVTKGTREVDGLIENTTDTFSLQNPHAWRGQPVVFDANGQPR
jgi:type II secretory pathway pseudopilin PulG